MMKPDKRLGKLFQSIFADLETDVLVHTKNGSIKEEDPITSTLFALAAERINKHSEQDATTAHKLRLTARQFQGRGRNSEESFIGADGAVSLQVSIGGVDIRKFYLFQAKKSEQKKFDDRAATQREHMLRCTPDSFFLVYSPKAITYISAFLVEKGDSFSDLPAKGFSEFNEDFFNCFIGDHFFGFPDFPHHRQWRYPPYDYPAAKNNLWIEISDAV